MANRIAVKSTRENEKSGLPFQYMAEVNRGIRLGDTAFGLRVDLNSKTLALSVRKCTARDDVEPKDTYLLTIKEYYGTALNPTEYTCPEFESERRTIRRMLHGIPLEAVPTHVELAVNKIYNGTWYKRMLLRK
ncbi:MAG: hypothetical protein ABSE71_01195 [Candidatus Micrarchaeaceae archaeon]|jgi:hypothetical protein|nr:hypothetical protein [Candidatus Micrarchaeota archaeon]